MEVGNTIADRFEVERRVAAGGMGAIFRARDRLTGAPIAVKVAMVSSSAERERFMREAGLLASLEHPAIVRYVDHGAASDHEMFLAMEWLEGETLSERLVRLELGEREAIDLCIRVAEALGVAHKRGIVHRDIKPENIFLVGGEVAGAKLLDFGVARRALPAERLTATGTIVGTPGYMAPEQARGEADFGPQVDVFALGCVLYRCLTQMPAFSGTGVVDVLLKVARVQVLRLREARPEVSPVLDDLVARLLAQRPADRPSDGHEVAAALIEALPQVGDGALPRREGLTAREQKLVSLIVVSDRPAEPKHDLPTMVATVAHDNIARIRDVVEKVGLTLELLSDRTMAVTVTGTDVATDQASRATHVALLILGELGDARVVVATGFADLSLGRPSGGVLRRALAMLDDVADNKPLVAPGEIVIDEVTGGLLDGRFEVATIRTGYVLKGRRTDHGSMRALGTSVPFVGRDRELAVLEATQAEVFADRVARCVVLTGVPGIGKTRLVGELVARMIRRDPLVTIFRARGDSLAQRSPFSFLANAIRDASGIRGGERPEAKRRALEERVARSLAGEDAARVAAFLGEMTGIPFPADATPLLAGAREDAVRMGDHIKASVEDFFAAEARRGPIVLVLEDLHWGDPPSVRLVDGALSALAELPLLVVATARPEVTDLFPSLWSERNPTFVKLGELGKRACERLVHAVLGQRDAAYVERLVARSGGNAFFLEELLRNARESRTDALPETVVAVVGARLERLSSPARRVLRAASVFGSSCDQDAIEHLFGGDDDLAQAIDELVAREIVTKTERDGGFEIAFRHAFFREAAYDALTPEDRSAGHRLAAGWLERIAEHDAVRLGEHRERGGELDKAIVHYKRAAEQALEGGDYEAAITRAERALACGASGADAAEALVCAMEAAAWSARFELMVDHATRAMALTSPGSPAWCRAGGALLLQGGAGVPLDQAIAIVSHIGASELDPDSPLSQVRLHAVVAVLLYRAGQRGMADVVRARLVNVTAEARKRDPAILGWIRMTDVYRGRFVERVPDETVMMSLEAAASFEQAGDHRGHALALVDAAYGRVALGDYAGAAADAQRAVDLAKARGAGYVVIYGSSVLGLALFRAGEHARGIETLRLVLADAERIQDHVAVGFTRHFLAIAHLEAGRLDDAAELVDGAEEIVSLPPTTRAYVAATKALIAVARGDAHACDEAARNATTLRDVAGLPEIAESWILAARLAALRDAPAEERQAAAAEARARLHARAARIDEGLRASFEAAAEQRRLADEIARASI